MSDPTPTAEAFIAALWANQSDAELKKIARYFKAGPGDYGEGDRFIGVRMGTVFELAKAHIAMPLGEIEELLDSDIHEARAGAVSIMARKAAAKKTGEEGRRELFELYLRRHERINNWDLVDLGAWNVVGRYLADKPRDVLYQLARSQNLWERRTAILATLHFVKQGEADDALALAERLLADEEDLIHKAVGGVLRALTGKHRERLTAFLERHAPTMPRVMLRYAIEHFPPEERAHYMGLKKKP
ncbi:DNA alkylation repair protein [Devosia geojensis]|uniref:DNA alkylation repair protein n=1 Tax=Devosia geojensis TaxID=443610 RepID=A0A0F5FDL9_9HYPH|nr:DNA alkylation repair protein [Devosia geojensis]KKB06888.1 DNA alkylation repair protein [Devosia geojensis]